MATGIFSELLLRIMPIYLMCNKLLQIEENIRKMRCAIGLWWGETGLCVNYELFHRLIVMFCNHIYSTQQKEKTQER